MKSKIYFSIAFVLIFVVIFGIIIVGYLTAKDSNESKERFEEEKEQVIEDNTNQVIENNTNEDRYLKITVNNEELIVKLENNDASNELYNYLNNESVTVNAHKYGNFEAVGALPFSLTTSDQEYKTKPGDVMLYQGNQITIFFDSNTWSYTKLGSVTNKSNEELKNILNKEDVQLIIERKEY